MQPPQHVLGQLVQTLICSTLTLEHGVLVDCETNEHLRHQDIRSTRVKCVRLGFGPCCWLLLNVRLKAKWRRQVIQQSLQRVHERSRVREAVVRPSIGLRLAAIVVGIAAGHSCFSSKQREYLGQQAEYPCDVHEAGQDRCSVCGLRECTDRRNERVVDSEDVRHINVFVRKKHRARYQGGNGSIRAIERPKDALACLLLDRIQPLLNRDRFIV